MANKVDRVALLTDPVISNDIERRIETQPEPKIFSWYINFAFSKFGPYLIVLFWTSIIVIGIFYGFDVLNLTNDDSSPPPGTAGAIAHSKMKQEFQSIATSSQVLLYFRCYSCATQPINLVPNMVTMSTHMRAWSEVQSVVISYSDYYTTSNMYNGTNGNMTLLANLLFVSKSNKSAIAIINVFDESANFSDFSDDIESKCLELNNEFGANEIKLSLTSGEAMKADIIRESNTALVGNLLWLLPPAMCVFATIVRSWRLIFIPLFCVVISICASVSLLRPFAEHVLNVHPFAPIVMVALTVALSIDYSLFLLTRFVEEIEHKECDVRKAVRHAIRWSGKVISVSGCVLCLTYIGLVSNRNSFMQSVGLGSILTIFCCVLVNLTLVPSLILIFPGFFSKFGWKGCPCDKIKMCNRHKNEDEQPLMVNSKERVRVRVRVSRCDLCWIRCGLKITQYPCSVLVIALVYAALIPFGYQVLSMNPVLDISLVIPRDSTHLHTFLQISHDFSAGSLSPFEILIVAKNGQRVYTNPFEPNANMTYLTETGLIINETIYKCYESGYDLTIEGVGYIGGATEKSMDISAVSPIPTERARMISKPSDIIRHTVLNGDATQTNINMSSSAVTDSAHNHHSHLFGFPLNAATQTLLYGQPSFKGYTQVYEFIINGKISVNRTSSYYSVVTHFDSYADNAVEFVHFLRKHLSNSCGKYGYKCYFSGGSVGSVDINNAIYNSLPWILSITAGTVFCLMGCVYKSIFMPFRLFVTIAVPLSSVFGIFVMVYQNGLLTFLNSPSVGKSGIFNLDPVMTVFILIGLALDYDIFLFTRIYEYRVLGKVPTNEAIVRGMYKTGNIITAAGVIMALSFGALIFSESTALCQTGFVLTIGVLIDTFVIRSILVPAILSIAKEVNWWPQKNSVVLNKEAQPIRNNNDKSM